MNVVKTLGYLPVSVEVLIDALPFRTMFWPDGDKAAEHLRYGQEVYLGPPEGRNPARIAEAPDQYGAWDDGWPTWLDDGCDDE